MDLHAKLLDLFSDWQGAPEDRVEVTPSGGGHYLVMIVSGSFEGQSGEERQERAWGRLLDHLNGDEQARIDYVFTKTPSEVEAILQDAKP